MHHNRNESSRGDYFSRGRNGLESFLQKEGFTGAPLFRDSNSIRAFFFTDGFGQRSQIQLRTLSIKDPWAEDYRPITAVVRANDDGFGMRFLEDCITYISNSDDNVRAKFAEIADAQYEDWKKRRGQSNDVLDILETGYLQGYDGIGTEVKRDIEGDTRAYFEPSRDGRIAYYTTNGRNLHYIMLKDEANAERFVEQARGVMLDHYVDKMMNVFRPADPGILVTARVYEMSGHKVDLIFYHDGGMHFDHYDKSSGEVHSRDLRLMDVNPFDAAKRLLRLLPKYDHDVQRELEVLDWVA